MDNQFRSSSTVNYGGGQTGVAMPASGLPQDPAGPGSIPNAPVQPPPVEPPVQPPVAPQPPARPPRRPGKGFGRVIRIGIILAIILLLGIGATIIFTVRPSQQSNSSDYAGNRFGNIQIPLEEFTTEQGALLGTRSLTINGQLRLNDAFIISPSTQPSNATPGQIYYNQSDNLLAYFNGTEFVELDDQEITVGDGISNTGGLLANTGVLSVQGQTGAISLTSGGGIAIDGTTLTNTGVTSLGGATGDIAIGSGLNLTDGTLSNTGVNSLAAGTVNLVITDDGAGNLTISDVGGGSGTVQSPGGTAGRIAKFTGAQTIADSLLSESGSMVTVNGDLTVTGSLALGTALGVGSGGTGATSLANNGVLVGQGASAVTAVTAGGSGLCLMSTLGAPAFSACPGSGGVVSLNGLVGALDIANATGSGATITIDDASTTQKGIAQFNATNFSASGGTINTIQNIHSGATPTFSGVNTNTITPSGAFSLGATGQAFTLQGNASSVINATNGVGTTTLSFQAPTANVTYRFAAATAGTYDVCTMVGNCAGVGGGVTTSGGTTNRIAKFTGAQSIGDSLLSESGATVTVTGNLNLAAGNQYQIDGTQISSADLSNDANLAKLDAAQTFTGTSNVFRNSGNSATAFSIQNASSQRLLTADTTNGEIELGQGSALGGRLVFNNASNANTITIIPSTATANRTITLPDDSGTVCLSTGNCAGAGVTLQSAYNNSTSPEITVDATRGALTIRDAATPIGANLLEVQNNAGSTTYLAVSATGIAVTGTATASGNINSTGGALQTNGTTRIDNTGNASNIGNISLSGSISGGTTYSGSGNINTTGGALQTAGTTRVDNTGNLVNIGNITGTGAITIASSGAGNDVIIDGADQFIVQDAAVFNAASTFNSDVDLTLADTENLSITSTVTGTNSVNLIGTVLTNNTSSGTQQVALLQNAAGSGTTEGLLVLDNADTDTAVANGLQITSAAGGITTALDVSDSDITTALLFGANDITGTNFSVTGGTGSFTSAGNGTIQGGTVTIGTASQAGSLVVHDGSSNTGTLEVAALGQNTTYILPDPGTGTVSICLTTGNCAGSGGGVTGSGTNNRVAKFSSTGSTIGDSTISDDGTTVSTTVDVVVQGGDLTVGTTSQLASLLLHDGNGQTTTLQAGNSAGNLTFILPTSAGTTNQCLKQSGSGNQLVWQDCDGGGGGSSATLQTAYNNGNSITTTDGRDIDIVLANTTTDSNFDLVVADGSTSFVSFARANGAGTSDPAQMLLIDNLDTDRALPVGVKLQAAAGGITTAIDATDAEITDALSVAGNNIVGTTGNIDFTNFDVVGATGNITTAGDLTVNGGDLTIGAAAQAGTLVVSDGSSNTGSISTAALSADRAYVLPNEAGTFCLQNSTNCGFALSSGSTNYIQNQTAIDQTADFRISGTGRVNTAVITPAIRPVTDSTTALQLQNAAGSSTALVVDTTNLRVGIGAGTAPAEALDVTGNLVVEDAGSTKGYRFRTSGSELDLESSGAALTVSTWSGAGFTGTQRTYLVLEEASHVAQAQGAWQFRTVGGGTVRHSIDGTAAADVAFNQNGEATNFTVQGDTDANLLYVQGSTDRVGIGTAAPNFKLDVNGTLGVTGAATITGNINSTGGAIQTNSTNRIDNTGNLVNIGNLTATGAITIASSGAGNDITINGADQFIVQDVSQFNAQVNMDLSANDELFISGTGTGTNTRDYAIISMTNNTTSGTQRGIFVQNNAGTGSTEAMASFDNADTDTAVTTGLEITSAAGGITTALDVSDADIVTALNVGANSIIGTTGILDFTNFDVDGSGNVTVGGTLGVTGITTLTGALAANGNITLGDTNADTLTVNAVIQNANALVFEGGTADANELTLAIATLSADRTITLPNETGTVCLQSSANCGFVTGTGAAWVNGGNTFGATSSIGNNDNFGLNILVNALSALSFLNDGSAHFRPGSNSTQSFDVEDSAGSNLFTINSTNSRVGINLGSTNVPVLDGAGLEVNGGLRLSGGAGSLDDVYTTPVGTGIGAKINIVNYNPGSGNTTIGAGLASTADNNATVVSFFDARTNANHWPTVSVFSPNEGLIGGITWAGSNTEVRFTTHNATGSTGGVALQSGDTAGSSTSSGAVAIRSGNGVGSNNSTGAITIDVGTPTGSGTAGNISIGTANAPIISIGNASSVTQVETELNIRGAGADNQDGILTFGTPAAWTPTLRGIDDASVSWFGEDILSIEAAGLQIGADASSPAYRLDGFNGRHSWATQSGFGYFRFLDGSDGDADFDNDPVIFGLSDINGQGEATFQNTTDSTIAFRVLDSSTTTMFQIDTTNDRIHVGDPTADSTGALLVLDTKDTSGDPTGVAGGMYYNSNSNTFRCYENGAWYDCLSRHKIVLGADVSDSSGNCNSFTDVTGLSFAVTSGVTYRFYAHINYTTSATTNGSEWTLTGPATSFLTYKTSYVGDVADADDVLYANAYDAGACTSQTLTNTGAFAKIEGTITPSANGTLQVRMATEHDGQTLTAKAGSTIEWW